MSNKIICEYCNKEIQSLHKNRHYNSKRCKEKQINIINTIEYKCKYCNNEFNQNDYKNKHELTCGSKDVYYELINTKKELNLVKENKDYIIKKFQEETKEQKETITDLRNQLYVLQKVSLEPKNNTNNVYINNLNVNFNEIKDHLPNYDINVLSNKMNIIKFILDIFINKLIVIDKKKKILGYYQENKSVNDIKCKNFFKSCARQLIEQNNELCNNYNGLLDQKTINQAYSNKQMIFGMIDNIDLFVKKEDGKIYIEYIINEVENK
jgi:transcriptional regulator with PAS, ATPase and Fis domain